MDASSDPCPAGCNGGLVGEDICATCNGSGEAEPAPARRPRRTLEPIATAPRDTVEHAPRTNKEKWDEWRTAARAEPAPAPPRVEPATDPLADLSPTERARVEAERFAPGPFGYVLRLEAKCIAAGRPAMSPWWRWSIGDFYASGKTWGVFDVGRGGGKSTTLELIAAAGSRYGERFVPPGQTWSWPFVSVNKTDAGKRVAGIASVLRADGVLIIGEFDAAAGERVKDGARMARAPNASIALQDINNNDIELVSVAGTIGNLSGPTTIGITIDEAAKLYDKSENANPLTEIVASAAETSRADPRWRGIICSSSWDKSGLHYEMIREGSNDERYVATIGQSFVDGAVLGLLSVAKWERDRGDAKACAAIEAHAKTVTASSPYVPTWLAHPGIGHPEKLPWDGAAVATRKLVDVLPEKALGGVSRVDFWLRENASVPLDRCGTPDDFALEWMQAFGEWYKKRAQGRARRPLFNPFAM